MKKVLHIIKEYHEFYNAALKTLIPEQRKKLSPQINALQKKLILPSVTEDTTTKNLNHVQIKLEWITGETLTVNNYAVAAKLIKIKPSSLAFYLSYANARHEAVDVRGIPVVLSKIKREQKLKVVGGDGNS